MSEKSEPQQKQDKMIAKVIVIGSSAVGKSNIISRFANNKFGDNSATIGIQYQKKDFKVGKDTLTITIWDTAGQEMYHSMSQVFYRKSDGVIMVYDISVKSSFTSIKSTWVKNFDEAMQSEEVTKILVGNKCDLVNNREVSRQEGEQLAEEIGAKFFEVSALNRVNIDEIFEYAAKEIIGRRHMGLKSEKANSVLNKSMLPTSKKRCC